MSEEQRKVAIKKVLSETGKVLGVASGNRLVVIRFPDLDQVKVAMRLFPRAFPKIRWKAVAARTGNAKLLAIAAVKATQTADLEVAVLHSFPGELEERAMDEDVAQALESAVDEGLVQAPVVLAIVPGSVRILVNHAPRLWNGKGGYYAWPSVVQMPTITEDDEPEMPEGGDEPPEEDETRRVLQGLKGEKAADYLVQVARTYLARGSSDQARLFLLRAVQIYSDSANMDGMADSYHLLGMGAHQRGDYEVALEWFNQAIDNLQIIDDKNRLAEAISQKGYVLYLQERYEMAVKAFTEALEIDQQLGNKEKESAGYRKLAMVLELTRRYLSAEDLYQKSLVIEEELGNRAGQARVFHHLGRLEELQEHYEQAVEFYEQSLAIKEDIGDQSGLATTYHQLGNLHLLKQDYDEALKFYEQAMETERNLGDRQSLARTQAQIGVVYRDLGQVEKALFHLVHAYQIFLKIRSPLSDEVLAKVEELQDLVSPESFNKILREASMSTSAL